LYDVQPAELLLRLELLGRYLQRFWPEWIRGDWCDEWSELRRTTAIEVPEFGERLAAPADPDQPDASLVRDLQRQMLGQWLSLHRHFFQRAAPSANAAFIDWMCDRLGELAPRDMQFPEAALEFLADCHNLVWFVLKERGQRQPGAGKAGNPPTLVLRPEEQTRDFGFRFSSVLALWATGRILGDGLRCRTSGGPFWREGLVAAGLDCVKRLLVRLTSRFLVIWAPSHQAGGGDDAAAHGIVREEPVAWEAILPQMADPARKLLGRLVSRSPASRTLWPELQRTPESPSDLSAGPPPRFRGAVADRLRRWTDFSRGLLGPCGQLVVDCLDGEPALTPRVAGLYRNRRSECHELGGDQRFEDTLRGDIRVIEERFPALMTAPRLECYDRVLAWDRTHFLPGHQREASLSPVVRPMIALSHSSLLLHEVERLWLQVSHDLLFFFKVREYVTRGPGAACWRRGAERRSLQAALSRDDGTLPAALRLLDAAAANLAEVQKRVRQTLPAACQTVHIGSAGLGDIQVAHLALANLRRLLAGASGAERWGEVLALISPEVGSAVLPVIGFCPLVHLAEPELRPVLRSSGIEGRHTQILLASPGTDSLRRQLREGLVKRALKDRAWFYGPLRRMLIEFLESGKPAENAFAVEVVGRLLDVLFGDVHRTSDLRKKDTSSAAAASRFRQWMQDPWRVQPLLHLLTRAIRWRCASRGQFGDTSAAERIHRLWFDLSKCCADGLADRRWPADLLPMLQGFLLRLCEATLRDLGFSARALGTGDIELDEVERLGCRLFHELVLDHVSRMRQRQTAAEGPSGPLWVECFHALPAWLLRLTEREGRLQRILWIHGLLRRLPPPQFYELNWEGVFSPRNYIWKG
jgi:hypothetical protein